jgi:twinkle protein
MLVPRELIIEAKQKMGAQAAQTIANDLQLEKFDEHNLKALCPFHNENTPSFVWNAKDNYFHCYGCGKIYGVLDHYISFYKLTYLGAVERLFEETDIKYSFGERGIKTKKQYKYPHYTPDDNHDLVEKYFAKRKISKETLDHCDVQQFQGKVAWNFYDENDVLLTVKCRHPRKPDKHEQKEWHLPDFDNSPILFNMNRIDPTQPLIVTEGMVDTLSVIESGYKNAVSIPSGTENTKWLEVCFDWLEQFEKIILWFDNDNPGVKARKEAASRLGIWRTLFVDIPTSLKNTNGMVVKDANEVLYYFGPEKVRELISDAKEIPITGVVNLADVEDFDLEHEPGLYTNLKPLDDIVYKLLFGSVLLLTGKRGSGKSSLLNQLFISESLDQGYDVFCFSGELDPRVLKSWIEINMAGEEKIKMKNKFIHTFNPPEVRKQIRAWYNSRIWVYDEIINGADSILEKAIAVTRKYGAKIWILDNLMTLDIGASDTNVYQKQKDLLVKLTGLAKIYNVLIVLVTHPRKVNPRLQEELTGDDIAGSGDMGNLAQYIFSVHRFTEKEKAGEQDRKGNYLKGKEPIDEDVRITALKNRYTGKVGDVKAFFNYPDYRFYTTEAEKNKRYKWNTDKAPVKNETNPARDKDEDNPF